MTFTYRNIDGHFGRGQMALYTEVIERAFDGFVMVEIGAYKGRSTCFAAQLMQRLHKDIDFTAVDHFLGIAGEREKESDLFSQFVQNMRAAGVEHLVKVCPIPSVDAARRFEDDSIDFIFIDGSHDYQSVCEDILAWSPKLVSGGLLAGDDFAPGSTGVDRAVRELVIPFFTRRRVWLNKERVP